MSLTQLKSLIIHNQKLLEASVDKNQIQRKNGRKSVRHLRDGESGMAQRAGKLRQSASERLKAEKQRKKRYEKKRMARGSESDSVSRGRHRSLLKSTRLLLDGGEMEERRVNPKMAEQHGAVASRRHTSSRRSNSSKQNRTISTLRAEIAAIHAPSGTYSELPASEAMESVDTDTEEESSDQEMNANSEFSENTSVVSPGGTPQSPARRRTTTRRASTSRGRRRRHHVVNHDDESSSLDSTSTSSTVQIHRVPHMTRERKSLTIDTSHGASKATGKRKQSPLLKEIDKKLKHLEKLRAGTASVQLPNASGVRINGDGKHVKRPWSASQATKSFQHRQHYRSHQQPMIEHLDDDDNLSPTSPFLQAQVHNLSKQFSMMQDAMETERSHWSQERLTYQRQITKLLDHIERLEVNISEIQKDHHHMFALVRKSQTQMKRIDAIDELIAESSTTTDGILEDVTHRVKTHETRIKQAESTAQVANERSKQNETHLLRNKAELDEFRSQSQDFVQRQNTFAHTQNLLKEQLRLLMLGNNMSPLSPSNAGVQPPRTFPSPTSRQRSPLRSVSPSHHHQVDPQQSRSANPIGSRNESSEKQISDHQARYNKLKSAYIRVFGDASSQNL
uniref:Uncharacterized protein n=1 Tax=Percolomonas cosmopolitus TaxID=63605 RepID=A0A7S1PI20_9EUKA